MIGKPAPEFRIKEWKNGEPVTFADLRGKVVLVDFWGYWCGGCVRIMPELFKLHDQYKEKGLVIVSVHDNSVASIKEMDNKLAGICEDLWDGRDLPFLVALDGGGKTKIPNTEYEVDGETTAAYGIFAWPTTFLVDQNGIVVGPVSCFTDECRKKVEEMLNGKHSQPNE